MASPPANPPFAGARRFQAMYNEESDRKYFELKRSLHKAGNLTTTSGKIAAEAFRRLGYFKATRIIERPLFKGTETIQGTAAVLLKMYKEQHSEIDADTKEEDDKEEDDKEEDMEESTEEANVTSQEDTTIPRFPVYQSRAEKLAAKANRHKIRKSRHNLMKRVARGSIQRALDKQDPDLVDVLNQVTYDHFQGRPLT